MFSPIKTIIANMSDRPCRLNLSERSLYIASPKGTPNSVMEVEGDVFSRFESNVEAEAFLASVLKGTVVLSYSLDERFVCAGCPENNNMKPPARLKEAYKAINKPEGVVENTEQQDNAKTDGEGIAADNKPEETKTSNQEDVLTQKDIEQDNSTINTQEEQESASEEKTEVQETNEETKVEDKPKKARKIKVQ